MKVFRILCYYFLLVGITGACFASDMYPSEFANKLRTCSPYKGSFNIDSKREIVGWRNGRCLYLESGAFTKTTCYFNSKQLSELSNAMTNNRSTNSALSVKYSDGSVAEYSTGSVASNVWGKYLNMSGVCNNTMIRN